ncbi:amidohydrolase [Hysterangium stoloniferum]|nr:amidohydrolase [Hysterangium stoloniferum]
MSPNNEEHSSGCFSPFHPLFRRIARLCRGQQRPVDQSRVHIIANSRGTPSKQERAVAEKQGLACGEPLPPYSSCTNVGTHSLSANVLETMEAKVDELNDDLRNLSLLIHDHPELMFQEKFAHDTLTTYMAAQGFTVTPHYLGLETAWRASFKNGTGGPVLGVNSEMDALPGLGHACGHNLIAIAGVGVALGVKAALVEHNIPGEVVLLGTPAEEGGGGKGILLDRGGYADMDACLMCHPGAGVDGHFEIPPSLAIQSLNVEFFGQSAHAAITPWEGVNALDAAVLAYSSISALRQQVKPECRIHGIIKGENWAANGKQAFCLGSHLVIPDYAEMNYIVRAPTCDETAVLAKRVAACFECVRCPISCLTLKFVFLEVSRNLISIVGREYIKMATQRYGMVATAPGKSQASTDFVSFPGLNPILGDEFNVCLVISSVSANHTAGFAEAARSEEAHASTLRVVKSLAATGLLLCSDKTFLQEVCDSPSSDSFLVDFVFRRRIVSRQHGPRHNRNTGCSVLIYGSD